MNATESPVILVEFYGRVLNKGTYKVHAARNGKTLCGQPVPADATPVPARDPLVTLHDRAAGCLRCERIMLAKGGER